MTRELVVIVRDAGTDWVGMLAAAARARGCRVGLVGAPLTPQEAGALGGVVDDQTTCDPQDTDQIVQAITGLAAGDHLGAVLSASDGALVATAQAAARLGVRGVPVPAAARARDKYAARVALQAAGQPVPAYQLMRDPAEAARVAAEVGLPAVLKPISGGGSHLVLPVRTAAELAAAYRTAASALLRSPHLRHLYDWRPGGADPARTFLVEGRLQGPEYCVDVLVRDGQVELLPLIDKPFIDEQFFELGFVTPPIALEPEREQRIRAAASGAVSALGLDQTVAHIELIDDRRLGPTVVEVNARPGGFVPAALYSYATGVETYAEQLALARGAPSPRTPARLPIPLCGLLFYTGQAGRLRAIGGLDKLADHPDVVAVWPMVPPGTVLSNDHEVPLASALVAGFTDLDDLRDTYDQASSMLRFEVDQ